MLKVLRDQLAAWAAPVKLGVALLVAAGAVWWASSDPPLSVGEEPADADAVVVLLHGSGAAKDDLEPLAERLHRSMKTPVSFVLVGGPHRSGLGRRWIPSLRADTQAGLQRKIAEAAAEARQVVDEVVDDLIDDGVPPEKITVGGFSRGAMVALDVVAHRPDVSGLIAIAGGTGHADRSGLEGRPQLRALIAHGSADRVVGKGTSDELVAELRRAGHEVTYVEHEGGHQIPREVQQEMVRFLEP